jgi:hypothetical protein
LTPTAGSTILIARTADAGTQSSFEALAAHGLERAEDHRESGLLDEIGGVRSLRVAMPAVRALIVANGRRSRTSAPWRDERKGNVQAGYERLTLLLLQQFVDGRP